MSGRIAPDKKRILHVFRTFRPDFTGEGVFTERLTEMMAELEPSVEHDAVCVDTVRPNSPPDLVQFGEVIYFKRTPNTGYWTCILSLLVWTLRNIRGYDVVHAHTQSDRSLLFYGLIRLMGRRVVLSATLDDSIPKILGTYRPRNRRVVLRVLRKIDKIVAISPLLHAENLKFISEDQAALIPIGIRLPGPSAKGRDFLDDLGIDKSRKVIVFVGDLIPRKDPLLNLSVLERLVADGIDAHLLLVGPQSDPEYLRRLQDVVQENSLGDRVTMTGRVENVFDYFAASDLMLFPSKEEGFGTVVIEAMACGVPVVARRLPGVNEDFVTPATGALFDEPDEAFELTKALLRDDERRQALGRSAESLVRERYDLSRIAKLYLETYFPAEAVRDNRGAA